MSGRSSGFLSIARPYARRVLAAELDGVHVRGLAELAAVSAARPLVLGATHVSTWDPLVLLAIDERLPGIGHALMDATNLARLPFFGLVGAVPLDRSDHARALADLDRAAALVSRPAERMWIFPQGRHRPHHLRPMKLKPGLLRLVATAGAALVPVGIGYGYRDAPRPACAVSIGAPLEAQGIAEGGLEAIERALDVELARADAFLDGGEGAFEALIEGARAVPGEDAASRWLGKLVELASMGRGAR